MLPMRTGSSRSSLPTSRDPEGRVWTWDEAADLSIIDVDRSSLDRNLEPLLWAPEPGAVGDWVAIGGHPLGWDFTVATGYLVDTRQADVLVSPGNSGSPVVDAFGRVLGVATTRFGDGTLGIVPIGELCVQYLLDPQPAKRPARGIPAEYDQKVGGICAEPFYSAETGEPAKPPGC